MVEKTQFFKNFAKDEQEEKGPKITFVQMPKQNFFVVRVILLKTYFFCGIHAVETTTGFGRETQQGSISRESNRNWKILWIMAGTQKKIDWTINLSNKTFSSVFCESIVITKKSNRTS